MRISSYRRRWLNGFAAIALLVAPAAVAQDRIAHDHGSFEVVPTSNGVVLGAPHGTFDRGTDVVTGAAARRLGAGYVLFRGRTGDVSRINVNRPTEGAGLACEMETTTDRARAVYDEYVRLVRAAAGGRPLRLYVEVHGHAAPQLASIVDAAATGLTAGDATALKERFAETVVLVRRTWPSYPALGLRAEPVDRVTYTAACAKTIGILSLESVPRALHLEFPPAARDVLITDATAVLLAETLRGFAGLR
jgi:hypothetical protein